MCVLCVVKHGSPLPSRQDLLAMHRANPHGMGFVSKSLHYKGMNFEKFYNRLQFVPKDEAIIIHFRYATHGSVCAENCHPFRKGSMWFAHNGILDIKPRGNMTDSETAFQDILYPMAKEYGIFSDELAATVNEIIGYSKFAFMDKSGDIMMFGDFKKYHGYWCSNLNFVRYTDFMPRFSKSWYVNSYDIRDAV